MPCAPHLSPATIKGMPTEEWEALLHQTDVTLSVGALGDVQIFGGQRLMDATRTTHDGDAVITEIETPLGWLRARRVDTAERVVALTFDDRPTPEHTDEVLDVLAAHDARATFYLTGGESDDDPHGLRAIVAAGHELGNHTWSHRRLAFVSGATVADEIERTDAVFRAAGYVGPITFRPPGCKRLLTAPLYLASHDRTTVIWDLEPDSIPEVAADADAIVTYVIERVRPGSIVLLHLMYDSRAPSREALPRILERLAAGGYRFVTVSELLALR